MDLDCNVPIFSPCDSKASAVLQPGFELVESGDPQRWDSFVDRHPESRFCHLWAFRRTLEEAYCLNCVYLEIISQGKVVGVFPSIMVRKQGGYLLSLPFVEYGGPLCSKFATEDFASLATALAEAAQARNCERVLIGGGIGAEDLSVSKNCTRTVLQLFGEVNLEQSEDDIWQHCISSRARNSVRSAVKSGLRCEIYRGTAAVRSPFYNLYLRSMKRLCVPPHSQRFFESLANNLGERLVSCWAFKEREPVAVMLGGIAERRLHCVIMASDEHSWPLRPNDLIHWTLIAWARANGMTRLDLGSASSEDQLRFKRKWGAKMQDYAQILLNSNTSRQLQPPKKDREHTVAKKLWRYVPLYATRVVGPELRKRLL